MKTSLWAKAVAEMIGTFALVALGVGAAVAGAGYVGTALAFGAAIVVLAYSVGRISGGHVNPAVSLALAIRGDITWKEFGVYCASQIVGAFLGSAFVAAINGWKFDATGANLVFASEASTLTKSGLSWEVASILALIVECGLTFLFVLTILGVTHDNQYAKQGGLVIGVALTAAHLVGDGVTNTSVNPARSLSTAVFAAIGGNMDALRDIWVFLVAPLVGAALAALVWRALKKPAEAKPESAKAADLTE